MSCRTPARLHACTPARLHACTPALLHCTHVLPHCKHVHCKHAVSHVPLHMIIIPLRVRSCVVVNSVPDHSFFVCGLGHMGLGTNTPSATWATAQIRNLCRMAHGTWPTPGAVPDHPEPETEEDGFRRGQSLQAGPFAPVPLLQCAWRARAVRSGVPAAVWRPSSSSQALAELLPQAPRTRARRVTGGRRWRMGCTCSRAHVRRLCVASTCSCAATSRTCVTSTGGPSSRAPKSSGTTLPSNWSAS